MGLKLLGELAGVIKPIGTQESRLFERTIELPCFAIQMDYEFGILSWNPKTYLL